MTTSWLEDIVQLHKEFEAPLNFWKWSALSALSAVVKDNVWINRKQFKQYPCIYVLLYADSGLKKGGPIFMAKQLTTLVNNTRVISGRSSIQGIVKKLGTTESKPGGIVVNKATGFICASELSASLVQDEAALTILTDLYDRSWNPGNYGNLLKQEEFALKDPTITLLGGINEAHAEHLFIRKDLHGGFIGRCFIIHESKRNAINSLVYESESDESSTVDYNPFADYLKVIAKLQGPFKNLTKDTPAGRLMDDWYIETMRSIEKKEIKDPTGTLNRASEHVVKIAMLLSLSREPSLEISHEDMLGAINTFENLVGNVRKTTAAQGKTTFAHQKAEIINELLRREGHSITRQMLNKKFWMSANSQDWDLIMRSLADGGFVTIDQHGNNFVYTMPEKVVEELKEHMRGKS